MDDIITVVAVDESGVTCEVQGRRTRVAWDLMREAAGEHNAEDLRPAYVAALTQARTLARGKGLLAKRQEIPGAAMGAILGDPGAVLVNPETFATRANRDLGTPYTAADVVFVELDPDQVGAIRAARDATIRASHEIAGAGKVRS